MSANDVRASDTSDSSYRVADNNIEAQMLSDLLIYFQSSGETEESKQTKEFAVVFTRNGSLVAQDINERINESRTDLNSSNSMADLDSCNHIDKKDKSDQEHQLLCQFLQLPKHSQKKLIQSLFVVPPGLIRNFEIILQFYARLLIEAHIQSSTHKLTWVYYENNIVSPKAECDICEPHKFSACGWEQNGRISCFKYERNTSEFVHGRFNQAQSVYMSRSLMFAFPSGFQHCLDTSYGSVSGSKCEAVWHGDHMAYRCRTCGLSESSCMCMECFDANDHEGHDYRVYRSSAGGCCDCGDPLAWRESGFCRKHRRQREEPNSILEESQDESTRPLGHLELDVLSLLVRRVLGYCVNVLREVYKDCLKVGYKRPESAQSWRHQSSHTSFGMLDEFLPRTGRSHHDYPRNIQIYLERMNLSLSWLEMISTSCLQYRKIVCSILFEELPPGFKLIDNQVGISSSPPSPSSSVSNSISNSSGEGDFESDDTSGLKIHREIDPPAELERNVDPNDADNSCNVDDSRASRNPYSPHSKSLLVLDVFLKVGVLLPQWLCDKLGVLYLKLLFDQKFKKKYSSHFVQWYPYFINLFISANNSKNDIGMTGISRFIDRIICQLFHSTSQIDELEEVLSTLHGGSETFDVGQESSQVEQLVVFMLDELNFLYDRALRVDRVQVLYQSPTNRRLATDEEVKSSPDETTTMPFATVNCDRLSSNIHNRLITDLKTLLVHESLATKLLISSFYNDSGTDVVLKTRSAFSCLLRSVELLQQVNLQRRQCENHIEYESQSHHLAFVLDKDMSDLLQLFLAAIPHYFLVRSSLSDNVSLHQLSKHESSMQIAQSILKPIREVLLRWIDRNTLGDNFSNQWQEKDIFSDVKSFHLPLHRYFARLMQSICVEVKPRSKSDWQFLLCGRDDDDDYCEYVASKILLHPLRVLLFSREIKSGLWVRNGGVMMQQLGYYHSKHLRFSGLHCDIYLTQIAAFLLPQQSFTRFLLNQLPSDNISNILSITRKKHGVINDESHQPVLFAQRGEMLEEILRLLLQLVLSPTMICLSASSEPRSSTVECLLRREMLHWLSLGACSRSEAIARMDISLVEILKSISSCESLPQSEDIMSQILASVGAFDEPQLLGLSAGSACFPTFSRSTNLSTRRLVNDANWLSTNPFSQGIKMTGIWRLKEQLWDHVTPLTFESFTPSETHQSEINTKRQTSRVAYSVLNSVAGFGFSNDDVLVELQRKIVLNLLVSSSLLGMTWILCYKLKANPEELENAERLIILILKCLEVATSILPDESRDQQYLPDDTLIIDSADYTSVCMGFEKIINRLSDKNPSQSVYDSYYWLLCVNISITHHTNSKTNIPMQSSLSILSMLFEFSNAVKISSEVEQLVSNIVRTVCHKSTMCKNLIGKDTAPESRNHADIGATQTPSAEKPIGVDEKQQEENKVKLDRKEIMRKRQSLILERMKSKQQQFLSSNNLIQRSKPHQEHMLDKLLFQDPKMRNPTTKQMQTKEEIEALLVDDDEDDEWGFPTGGIDVHLYLNHVTSAIASEYGNCLESAIKAKTSFKYDRYTENTSSTIRQSSAQEDLQIRPSFTSSVETTRLSSIDIDQASVCESDMRSEYIYEEIEDDKDLECGLCRSGRDRNISLTDEKSSSFGYVGMILPTKMLHKLNLPGRANEFPLLHVTVTADSNNISSDTAMKNNDIHVKVGDTVVWTCGHVVHKACLTSYLVSLWRQRQPNSEDRVLNERENEFLCPICRRLSNCLVPTVPGLETLYVNDPIEADKSERSPLSFDQWLNYYMEPPYSSVITYRKQHPYIKSKKEARLAELWHKAISSFSHVITLRSLRTSMCIPLLTTKKFAINMNINDNISTNMGGNMNRTAVEVDNYVQSIASNFTMGTTPPTDILYSSPVTASIVSEDVLCEQRNWQLLLRSLEVQIEVLQHECDLMGVRQIDFHRVNSLRQFISLCTSAMSIDLWRPERNLNSAEVWIEKLDGLLFGHVVLLSSDIMDTDSTTCMDIEEERLQNIPILCHDNLFFIFLMKFIWRRSGGNKIHGDRTCLHHATVETFYLIRIIVAAQILQALCVIAIKTSLAKPSQDKNEASRQANDLNLSFDNIGSLQDVSIWIWQLLCQSKVIDSTSQCPLYSDFEDQVSRICLPLVKKILLLLDVSICQLSPTDGNNNTNLDIGSTSSNLMTDKCIVCKNLYDCPSYKDGSGGKENASKVSNASLELAKCLRALHMPPLSQFFGTQFFPKDQRRLCESWAAQWLSKSAVSRYLFQASCWELFGRSENGQQEYPTRWDYSMTHPLLELERGPNRIIIALPPTYLELFLKFSTRPFGLCSVCDQIPKHPAICLFCGMLLCFLDSCCSSEIGEFGECTMHAHSCGLGTGAFLLLRACTTLLFLGNSRRFVWGSLYVDKNGEDDPNLQRGKTLYLNQHRLQALETLIVSHNFAQNTSILANTIRRSGQRY